MELPPCGISSKPIGLSRKSVGRARRQSALRSKRQMLLLAGEELGLLQLTTAGMCSGLDLIQQGHMDAMQAVNGFHRAKSPCGTAAARRFLKHLSSCSKEQACEALEKMMACRVAADRPGHRASKQHQRKNRQRERATMVLAGDYSR